MGQPESKGREGQGGDEVTRVVHACEQRSDAWRALRVGRLTGSCADAMMAQIKTGEAAARRDLRARLVAERLTGRPQESAYTNDEMRWGVEHEAEAIAAYESTRGLITMPVGFVSLVEHMAGVSPDGVIGDFEGLVSIKCPKTATHLATLQDGRVPSGYRGQCLAELWVTGAKWIDFFSFDPRLPDYLQTFCVRMERDNDAIAEFERKALLFLAEVDSAVAALQTIRNISGQLAAAVNA